jgi:hypothetical protein
MWNGNDKTLTRSYFFPFCPNQPTDMGGAGFVHDPVFGVGTFLRPSTFGTGHQSLEEVEAQLLRTARGQPQRLSMQQHAQGDRKMMSLEEVEAALMNINGGRPIYSEAMLAEQQAKIALLEKRRAAREAKQAETVSENAKDIFFVETFVIYAGTTRASRI